MKGWLLLLLLLASPAALAQRHAPRAIWTWEESSYAMLESPPTAVEARRFLRAEGIGTLYLYADAFGGRNLIVSRPQLYRDFIEAAHHDGIRVYALLGSWYLHTEQYVRPAHQADARAMLQRVLDYNAAAPANARFDGVNYDIEPHLLDDWDDETRPRLLREFLDMSAQLMALKRASGQTLPIGPAMPFWWDGIDIEWNGSRKPVSEHVQDTCDYVALMDYRNSAEGGDGILAHAADEMAHAAAIGKPLVIGLEIAPSEPAKLSFHGRSHAELEDELAKVERAYRGQRAFAGFVFHHYRAYRDWREPSSPAQP